MPADSPETRDLTVKKTSPLTIRFEPDALVANWWVHLLVGTAALRDWTGNTNDAAADAATVGATDLAMDRIVLGQLLLFGSVGDGDIKYTVRIVAEQDGNELDAFSETGTVKQGTTALVSGAWKLKVQ